MDVTSTEAPSPDHPDDLDGYGLGRAALIYLYLDEPAGTLTPAQIAATFGYDGEELTRSMLDDEEQAQMAAAEAASARRAGAAPEDVEVDLHEAREWANSAQVKRLALVWLHAHPDISVEVPDLTDELRAVRDADWAWIAALRRQPDTATEDTPEVQQRRAERDAAVAAMRARLVAAVPA